MHTLTGPELDARLSQPGPPMLVDFWATWCRPCRLMERALVTVEERMQHQLDFVKIDVDAAQALARRLGIWSVPTLLLHDQGRVIDTISGAHPANAICEWIEARLARTTPRAANTASPDFDSTDGERT